MEKEKVQALLATLETGRKVAAEMLVAEDQKLGKVGSLGHPLYNAANRSYYHGLMTAYETAIAEIKMAQKA